MKKQTRKLSKRPRYTNEKLGKLKIIKDFLPPPSDIKLKDEEIAVTLKLHKSSIDFFKHEAKEQHTPFKKVISALLDSYAAHHSQK